MRMIVGCRNGATSYEIARTIGCMRQSARHVLHRVRHILKREGEQPITSVLEIFVGGLCKFMSGRRRRHAFSNCHPIARVSFTPSRNAAPGVHGYGVV